ncbi:DUF4282 domain-containing protein [Gilliamella apicola]|uniref:DUF4282 domain-containing protein n=2 Tax=Gilliamella apicola TaxID=1196095 RepID=A0A242NDZ4_9GAMM|nr:DUF4282 domain-containing protein [Gilliamella apicola]OTP86017.1 hypothetical protein B5S44_02920 [Gilliamella apicola]OTP88407.1 hypothetical protein B5S42_07970 [Gilliamella apicola]OTP97897.1 hypothetical protein B6D08_13120 [Gilliamella apicola]OTQ08516.1 hypothetical protein B6C87_11275 [Gilliamella apicola]OTQ09070.1 hypothetical protein B6C91_10325 [Gilliamella apicola]
MNKIVNSEKFSLGDFFFLKKMITPVFMTVIYWVTLALIAIGGLGMFFASFAGFRYSFFGGMFGLIGSIITLIIGVISTRIVFELICVLFNINRNLEKLALNKDDNTNDSSNEQTIISHDKF